MNLGRGDYDLKMNVKNELQMLPHENRSNQLTNLLDLIRTISCSKALALHGYLGRNLGKRDYDLKMKVKNELWMLAHENCNDQLTILLDLIRTISCSKALANCMAISVFYLCLICRGS